MCLPQATHAYFTREIANVVTEQINESKGIAWEANVLTTFRNQQEDDNDRVLQNAHHVNEELRIEIKLDITLNNINLSDKVEWDISDPRNNPEEFAQQFANDLGLPGEFTTAIAHSIREQADSFQRSLGLIEHVVGHPINNDELKYQFLPPVSSSSLIAGHSGSSVYGIAPTANSQPFTSLIRSKQAILAFTPRLDQLSYEEIAIKEKEREREARRKRRSTRGRQRVNLPDRESVKTHRTLVPKPGSKEVSSHQPDVDGEGVIWAEAEFAQPWKYKRVWPPGSMKADEERRKTPRYEQQVASDDDSASQPPHVPKRNQLNNLNRADSFAPHVNGSSNSPYQYAQTMSDQGQSSIPVAGPSRRGGIGRGRKKGTAHSPAPLYQRQSASPAPTNALVGDYESLGLHPVWIEGRWHCSNCGGPDGIVQGKRKGPAGDKTLCAACGKWRPSSLSWSDELMVTEGKYYTRYKKHRPCVYTIDPVRHREFIQADQEAAHIASTLPDSLRHARIASNGPSGNTADPLVVRIMPRAQSPISELSRDSSPEMYRPPPRRGRSPKHESPAYTNYDKFDQEEHHSRSRSDTTSSSASSNVPLAALSSAPSMGPPQANAIQSSSTYFDDLLPQVQSQNSQNAKVKLLARPPPWMLKAAASLRAERPDDKFDITAKGPKPGDDPSNQEFRIRCMDCPGKVLFFSLLLCHRRTHLMPVNSSTHLDQAKHLITLRYI